MYQGQTARLIHHYLPERQLHLFDTFEGFGSRGVNAEMEKSGFEITASHFADTSLAAAKDCIRPVNSNVHFYKGYFPDSVPENFGGRTFSFVHLDADLYEPIHAGLEYFYPRVSSGGFILVHDYNSWPGSRMAVDEFFADKPEVPIPMPDKSGSVLITRS